MSKKFGKFFMVATLGALAGGAYYLLKKKDMQAENDLDDDDDFDEFDEDLDGEDASGKTEADRKFPCRRVLSERLFRRGWQSISS